MNPTPPPWMGQRATEVARGYFGDHFERPKGYPANIPQVVHANRSAGIERPANSWRNRWRQAHKTNARISTATVKFPELSSIAVRPANVRPPGRQYPKPVAPQVRSGWIVGAAIPNATRHPGQLSSSLISPADRQSRNVKEIQLLRCVGPQVRDLPSREIPGQSGG